MSMLQTLRPGLLVSLKTSVTGNVSYTKTVLDNEKASDGAELARWETERKIADPKEHKMATEARSKAGHLIRRVCTASAFGLLCPEAKAKDLDEAIAEARKVADAFNEKASLTQLTVHVIKGRIAEDDREAVTAINSEVRELLASMEEGLANLDVKKVREAASKAKSMGQMLSTEAGARIEMAVNVARESARRMVKAGEQAAAEIDRAAIRKISESRTAFLDLDEVQEIAMPTTIGRAVDLSPMQ